jgi:thioredoxin 1
MLSRAAALTEVPTRTRTEAVRAEAVEAIPTLTATTVATAHVTCNRRRTPVVVRNGGNESTMSALPDVSKGTWQQDVLASEQPVLVDFWAPWCGPCKMLAPVVEKVAAANTGRAKFVKLNTDENPELGAQYAVVGIPCLILFKGGREVDRIVGFVTERAISAMLAKHVSSAA